MPSIAAIVLAAGNSSRMGRPKLLLPLAGKALVRHVVEAAIGPAIGEVIVVTGEATAEPGASIGRVLAGLPVRLIANPLASLGQSTSLRAGLAALSDSVAAAVMLLGDQPLVAHDLIAALVAAYRQSGKRIIAPVYAGRRGNPVVFDRSLFAELAAVTGDQGGRAVIERHAAELELMPVEDPATLVDVDTWAEYQQLLAASAAGPGTDPSPSPSPTRRGE